MKYQVIKSCVIGGSPKKAGAVVDVSGVEAVELMSIGRIAPYSEPVIEDRSVGLSDEDRPRKRGRPKKVSYEYG